MSVCSTCGNEIPGAGECPFCGAVQHGAGPRRNKGGGIVTVNLERGLPTVDEALAKLDREIGSARMRGVRLIRVIHGWGSSGTGGKIKPAVLRWLETHRRAGKIRGFVAGDDYSEDTNRGRAILAAYPSLRSSLRTDRGNPGITFVEV